MVQVITAAIIHTLTMLCQEMPWESSPLLAFDPMCPQPTTTHTPTGLLSSQFFPNRPMGTKDMGLAHCHLTPVKNEQHDGFILASTKFSHEPFSSRSRTARRPSNKMYILHFCQVFTENGTDPGDSKLNKWLLYSTFRTNLINTFLLTV